MGLAIALSGILLLASLSRTDLVDWGPCGPDPFGLILLLGVLICSSVGSFFTIAGLIQRALRKLRREGTHLPVDQASEEFL